MVGAVPWVRQAGQPSGGPGSHQAYHQVGQGAGQGAYRLGKRICQVKLSQLIYESGLYLRLIPTTLLKFAKILLSTQSCLAYVLSNWYKILKVFSLAPTKAFLWTPPVLDYYKQEWQ